MMSAGQNPLLRLNRVSKSYYDGGFWNRSARVVRALESIDLELAAGRTLAICGESGSGKSTLALCIAQLQTVDSGEVWFDGVDLTKLRAQALKRYRRQLQVIFQDSASALNPRLTVEEILAEPLLIAKIGSSHERREGSLKCLGQVGLSSEYLERRPLELSGGQRQRVAIARALTLNPKLLILDEAFSGLDLLVQEQILALLQELQRAHSLAYLLITHDLALAPEAADEVAIMHDGKIVEQGSAAEIVANPQHRETQALVAAMPRLDQKFAAGSGA